MDIDIFEPSLDNKYFYIKTIKNYLLYSIKKNLQIYLIYTMKKI